MTAGISIGILNLADVKLPSFPGGERNIRLDASIATVHWVKAIIRSSDDLMDLVLLTEILRRRGCDKLKLLLPYIPYARQDRATTDDSAFSLRAFASIINMLEYAEVHVYEPHSDVAPALINNCVVHSFAEEAVSFAEYLVEQCGCDNLLVLAPDAGAAKRAMKVSMCIQKGYASKLIGQALKDRNPATGKLEITYVSPNVAGKDVLVVDDICDGGATFLQLAPELKKMGAKSMHLFVAHGIFSKGIDELSKSYQSIGTTDSFYDGRFPLDVHSYSSL